MSYRERLDKHSGLFHQAHTSRKRLNSQVNGETQVTHNTILARGNAKAHRMS